MQDGKLFIHGERTEPEEIERLEYRVQSLLGSGTVTIVRRGDKLKFAGATCKIEEIQAVDYVESITRTFSLGYGLLVLTVGGRKYRLFFVDDVARVANLLSRLRFLAKECD